jgi:hypothetical protein
MGHSYSDFATYTTEFCGKEHPHKPHDNGYMYHENTCPGFKVEEAQEYSLVSYINSNSVFRVRGDGYQPQVCNRCGSLVLFIQEHDEWHERIEDDLS